MVDVEQYAMRAFADALESIPIALAENSGLPPIGGSWSNNIINSTIHAYPYAPWTRLLAPSCLPCTAALLDAHKVLASALLGVVSRYGSVRS